VNLKLKRLVRTPASEQYALFDLDQIDAADQPATIGKLDLHFTGEGMYGTLLLWDDSIRALRAATRRAFVRALLADLAQPMGVPNEYVVEFFAPTLDHYEVIHNVGLDAEDDEEIDEDAGDDEILDTRADAQLAIEEELDELALDDDLIEGELIEDDLNDDYLPEEESLKNN
jgi:hypothetical protein